MNKETAIIIFTRFAGEEAKIKGFANQFGKQKGTSLTKKLISHSLKQTRKTNLPVFTFFPNRQNGNSFGEKLSNCIEEVYNNGYENVIVIGNDCPSINTSLLNEVQNKLEDQKLIIGPAFDGGVYLLGLNKSAYVRKDFINIPWLTNKVSSHFFLYASKRKITLGKLQPQVDIDNFEGLFEWMQNNRRNDFHLIFTSLINSIGNDYLGHFKEIYNFFISRSSFALRGPPPSF